MKIRGRGPGGSPGGAEEVVQRWLDVLKGREARA